MKKITFLHTAAANVASFERLAQEMAPNIPTEHILDERLLADAFRDELREQDFDQRERAHIRGAGERKAEKPELRGGGAQKAREQRRPPFAQDRFERVAIEQ